MFYVIVVIFLMILLMNVYKHCRPILFLVHLLFLVYFASSHFCDWLFVMDD